jgi:hexaprenyl diphosphate synthase
MARWLCTSHPALQRTVDLTLARPGKAIRPALTLLVHGLAMPSAHERLPHESATAPHLRPLPLQEVPRQCRAELSTLHEDPTRLLDLSLPAALLPHTQRSADDAASSPTLNGCRHTDTGSATGDGGGGKAPACHPPLASEREEPAAVMLAGVVEMIHTASLVHDDVVDRSDTRRGGPSVAAEAGSQHAVLAGDYLLARASVALARIGEPRVTALMSAALASLVEGEFLQLDCADPTDMHAYVRKCYHKTACLFAHACQSAALLAGADAVRATAAASFGRHLGLAFQVTDDLLDLTSSADTLGKPCGADLELGLATAPVLYALRSHASLRPLIQRRFAQPGDVHTALACVRDSDALERTAQLAAHYGECAQRDLEVFNGHPYVPLLRSLVDEVVHRVK